MIFNSGYPSSLWEFVVAAATYIYNKLPNKSIDLEYPYFRYFEKELYVSNLGRLECLEYTGNTDP